MVWPLSDEPPCFLNAAYRIMPTETLMIWFFGTIPGPSGFTPRQADAE